MSNFLKVFDKNTNQGKYFRRYVTAVGLLEEVDQIIEGRDATLEEISNLEDRLKRNIGIASVNTMIAECASKIQCGDLEDKDSERVEPEVVEPEVVEPEVVEPEVVTPEIVVEADQTDADVSSDDTTETTYIVEEDENEQLEESEDNEPQKENLSHTISISYSNKNMKNMGSFSGEGTYDHESSATLVATANEGYHFAGWKVASSGEVISDNPLNITVLQDESFGAMFKKDK